ncbi:hypothetical protein LOD99_2864 [Oopsacas minuta]|uniref:Hexosyltransferase n=1 Tax=Oopsacas minuta TaxID=111878 RepID=A0AAV7JYL7_9METZ|nr:hypothetical protein LOD99_2864 [Oopsacas minuta]
MFRNHNEDAKVETDLVNADTRENIDKQDKRSLREKPLYIIIVSAPTRSLDREAIRNILEQTVTKEREKFEDIKIVGIVDEIYTNFSRKILYALTCEDEDIDIVHFMKFNDAKSVSIDKLYPILPYVSLPAVKVLFGYFVNIDFSSELYIFHLEFKKKVPSNDLYF